MARQICCSHQKLTSSRGDSLVGNHNVVRGSCSDVIGNHNVVHGNCENLIGNHNTVTGSVGHQVGIHNSVSGHVYSAMGNSMPMTSTVFHLNGSNIVQSSQSTASNNFRVATPSPPRRVATQLPSTPVHDLPAHDDKTCIVCLVNATSVVLVPCGHAQFCMTCMKSQVQVSDNRQLCCPTCRTPCATILPFYTQ